MSRRPLAVVAAVVACVGAAVWFASSWIDRPPDGTCGSIWRTDLWVGRPGCEGKMALRATAAVALALLPLALELWARRRRNGRRQLASPAVAFAVAALVLLTNEFVREGGAWAE